MSHRSPLWCLFLVMALALPLSAANDLPAGFRGFGGTGPDWIRLTEESVLADLKAGNTALLERFLDGAEALDDPSVLAPALRRFRGPTNWPLVHRESPTAGQGPLATRLTRLLATPPRLAPPRPVTFPRDGGRHLNTMIEWWYFNGHLTDEAGAEYGYELCFFRAGPIIHFAHFAITDVTGMAFRFRRKSFSPFACSLSDEETRLAYGDWSIEPLGEQSFLIKAREGDMTLQLRVANTKPTMLFDQTGYVPMGTDVPSYYYSMTRMESGGVICLGDRVMKVTGTSWFDHQWGNFVRATIRGWDWFSVKLEDRTEYNVFAFHGSDGKMVNPVVTIMHADGSQETTRRLELTPLAWWVSPHTHRRYPSGYLLKLPEKNTTIEVRPKVVDQELPANGGSPDFIDYWEGTCWAKAAVAGKTIPGVAYNEICGYPKTRP